MQVEPVLPDDLSCHWGWWWSGLATVVLPADWLLGLFLQLVQVGTVTLGPSNAAGDGGEVTWPQEIFLLTISWDWS